MGGQAGWAYRANVGSQIHDELELEAVVEVCNHPDCWDVENQRWREKATRFFKTKRDQDNRGHTTLESPAPGERFYFGRCEKHSTPDVLNYDLVEETTLEELHVSRVMFI